jgi:RNA polymerase sigma-70 factor (ECF subfamily)
MPPLRPLPVPAANLSLVGGVGGGDGARARTTRRSERVLRTGTRAPDEESDLALVEQALAGEATSKERLYRKHVDYIAGMCARLLRSVEASEDVVQDAFVIAFEQLESLRDPAAFRPWLAAIAVSQVRRRLSRRRLLRFIGLDRSIDDAPLDDLVREDTSAEVRSELAALDLVLQQLPPNHRIAWMLRYVEDESLEDVATSCRCSLATVKRWIAAADASVQRYVLVTREGGR